MIKIGFLSSGSAVNKYIDLIQQENDLKLTNYSIDTDLSGESSILFKAEEVLDSSDAVHIDLPSPGFKLLKLVIRRSNHLFSVRLPSLSMNQLNDLIALESEAGSVTQFFNPYVFSTDNLKLLKRFQTPALINIRCVAAKPEELEEQLMNLLLYLILLDKSEFKKADLFSMENKDGTILLDIRLTFSSGTIAGITLSSRFNKDQSQVEIFQQNQPIVVSTLPTANDAKFEDAKQNAIKHFVKAIKNRQAVLVSLPQLLQAKIVMESIKEKMRNRGSLLFS